MTGVRNSIHAMCAGFVPRPANAAYDDGLGPLFRQLARVPLLTAADEQDLFRRIEIALVASSLAALASFSVALKWRLSIAQPADAGPVGPLPELPLET